MAPIDSDAGSTLLPLSYLPASAIPADVLADGRILFEPDSRLAPGRLPSCFWSTPMAPEWSRIAAITASARWGGRQLARRRRGLHARRFAGALYFAAGARGAGRCAARRIRRRNCRDGLRRMAAECAGRGRRALCVEALGSRARRRCKRFLAESGENLVDPVLVAPRNRPNRHPSALARLELRQYARARCAAFARGRS